MRRIEREIEDLLKQSSSGRLTLWNLPSVERYTTTVVSCWICRYWSQLEAVHLNGEGPDWEFSNDLHLVWADLSTAIDALPDKERRAIRYITEEGLPLYRSIQNTTENVAAKMRMNNKELRTLLQGAYKRISEVLEG